MEKTTVDKRELTYFLDGILDYARAANKQDLVEAMRVIASYMADEDFKISLSAYTTRQKRPIKFVEKTEGLL